MEEEIDVRPYIEAVLKNWKWIVAVAVLTAVVAFIITSLSPPKYTATALVAVIKPGQLVQFDERFAALAESQPLKAYPELATSDEILQTLLAEIADIAPDVQSLETLRAMTEASAGADPSLLRLSVTYGQPETTAQIANLWAELFVNQANKIFGNQGGEQLVYFESQQESAAQELARAEQSLIEFQARNRSLVLENQLMSLQQSQANQLAKQQQIGTILQDIQGLQSQLEQGARDAASSYSDQLTALLLQIRAFGGSFNSELAVPWQLQIDANQFASTSRSEQIAFLAGLQTALTAQLAEVETNAAVLEPQILVLQQQKQEMDTENNRLTRNYTLAEETYTALARKVEEERITSQDTNSGVQIASRTAVPEEAARRGQAMNTAVAAALGAFLVLFWVVGRTWWSQATQDRESANRQS
ncbi:MAG: hypothetical protein IPM39_04155 [Chloroflexi bacterium]|nr:hypothetical protein [Chloroflexota bacterium]